MKINVENNILQGLQKTITEVSQQLAFYQIDKLRNEYRIHIAIHFYTQGVWPTFYQHLLLWETGIRPSGNGYECNGCHNWHAYIMV